MVFPPPFFPINEFASLSPIMSNYLYNPSQRCPILNEHWAAPFLLLVNCQKWLLGLPKHFYTVCSSGKLNPDSRRINGHCVLLLFSHCISCGRQTVLTCLFVSHLCLLQLLFFWLISFFFSSVNAPLSLFQFQLQHEKAELEQHLEQEQEFQVNKLMKKIKKMENETISKQLTLEQVCLLW